MGFHKQMSFSQFYYDLRRRIWYQYLNQIDAAEIDPLKTSFTQYANNTIVPLFPPLGMEDEHQEYLTSREKRLKELLAEVNEAKEKAAVIIQKYVRRYQSQQNYIQLQLAQKERKAKEALIIAKKFEDERRTWAEEKRKILVEENRRKAAARQKLIALEKKIAKRKVEQQPQQLGSLPNNQNFSWQCRYENGYPKHTEYHQLSTWRSYRNRWNNYAKNRQHSKFRPFFNPSQGYSSPRHQFTISTCPYQALHYDHISGTIEENSTISFTANSVSELHYEKQLSMCNDEKPVRNEQEIAQGDTDRILEKKKTVQRKQHTTDQTIFQQGICNTENKRTNETTSNMQRSRTISESRQSGRELMCMDPQIKNPSHTSAPLQVSEGSSHGEPVIYTLYTSKRLFLDEYMKEMMDLKILVTQTLEKKGVLTKIRAELSAGVFKTIEDKALENEDGASSVLLGSCSDQAKQFHASPLGRLLTALIWKHLEWTQFGHILTIYLPKCNLPRESQKFELRENFEKKVETEISKDGTYRPLLIEILETYLKLENSFGNPCKDNSTSVPDDSLSNDGRHLLKPPASDAIGLYRYSLPKDLQKVKYKHHEAIRTEKLRKLLKERERIIQQEQKENAINSHSTSSAMVLFQLLGDDITDKLEKRRIGNIRRRQERELHKVSKCEVQLQQLADKNQAYIEAERKAEEFKKQK